MKVKAFCLFLFLFSCLSAAWSFGFEDCFNYQRVREDMKEYELGWKQLEAFESNKDNFILDKRWPTVNLKLTPVEERARFGTTGLETFQKAYLAQRFDGTQMRMIVFVKVVRAKGERRVIGWRAEKNPAMPKEYLDPTYPDEKKKGGDWKLLVHWVHPSDIRGMGILSYSYNNKKKDDSTWIWFPSLRKVRRLTPANGGDFVAGTYKTYSEAFQRRIIDEVHQIIGETKVCAFLPTDYFDDLDPIKKFGPLTLEYMRFYNALFQSREAWVVRSISVKGGYCDYYHTRIWTADKEWGYGPLIEEMYNKKGRLTSTHFWPWRRVSSYDGTVAPLWGAGLAEDMNFEDRGFSWWTGPQTNLGFENPDAWFTLRELTKSIPTVNIPYMAVFPPKKLLPIEALFPSEELQEAYRKCFPKRRTSFPNAESPLAIEEW